MVNLTFILQTNVLLILQTSLLLVFCSLEAVKGHPHSLWPGLILLALFWWEAPSDDCFLIISLLITLSGKPASAFCFLPLRAVLWSPGHLQLCLLTSSFRFSFLSWVVWNSHYQAMHDVLILTLPFLLTQASATRDGVVHVMVSSCWTGLFIFWLNHWLAMCPQSSSLSSLIICFFIWKLRVVEEIKWNGMFKVITTL